MVETIVFDTLQDEVLVDITYEVNQILRAARVEDGLLNVFTPGDGAAVLIQPCYHEAVSTDILDLLKILIPEGVWLSDNQNAHGAADAHIKAGIIGPSKMIPIVKGSLMLSESQRVLFCEFNGPRRDRLVVCTVIADR